jgi:hypothetical protein
VSAIAASSSTINTDCGTDEERTALVEVPDLAGSAIYRALKATWRAVDLARRTIAGHRHGVRSTRRTASRFTGR